MPARRTFLKLAAAFGMAHVSRADAIARPVPAEPWVDTLLDAATSQIGVTVTYDPAYVQLDYPNGDLPRDRGVCCDVVIRAYRDAFGLDLQRLVHEDMQASFASYPKSWGLSGPDRNIDHRRVPNLETFFRRRGWELPATAKPEDWKAGDLFTQRLPGGQPHIGIVSSRLNGDGTRPLGIHNIGAGTRLEDIIFSFKRVGHFRIPPA